jgi:hypothetical protein
MSGVARWMIAALAMVAALVCSPAMADPLSKDVAGCLVQARAALGTTFTDLTGHTQNEQIDAYVAEGRIYFFNPFVSQGPTFAFWKCLRLRGYNFPS